MINENTKEKKANKKVYEDTQDSWKYLSCWQYIVFPSTNAKLTPKGYNILKML